MPGYYAVMSLQEIPADLFYWTPQGTWRIAGTWVSINSVIHSFLDGATSEEICQDFPSLSLAQVYSTIAYYLTHRTQVDAYLQEQQRQADKLEQELQTQHAVFLAELRQRLLKPSHG